VRRPARLRRRRAPWLARFVATGVAAAAVCPALAPAATAPTPTPTASSAAVYTRLSNLRSVSRWAYPNAQAAVRSGPSSRAAVVGHLRLLTIDDQAELYVALTSAHTPSGETWVKIELPGRPNGKIGWVPRGALGPLHVVNAHLVVDRERLRVTLFRNGRAVFSAPVGVGKASTITPGGNFYVMEKLRAINGPIYGPFALGTSAYAPTLSEWPGGGIVGIHGTDEPGLIPGRPSHGCVRMRNADITRLWAMVGVGTPIRIS
jgi:L,D-transpeptidase catalytic domain